MIDPKTDGLIRHILTAVGGGLVLLGIIDEATVSMIVGAVMNIIGFVWSFRSKKEPATDA